jgi:hypothetical protein
MPRINPENLGWARERAGLSLEDAARGIITGLTGVERLSQMESGQHETREALLLTEDAQPALVSTVTLQGYGNLNEDEVEQVGRDPFLISYGLIASAERTIVPFEVSSPAKQRANRKSRTSVTDSPYRGARSFRCW